MPQAVVAGVIAGIAYSSVSAGIYVAAGSLVLSELMKPDLPDVPEFREDYSPTAHLQNTTAMSTPINVIYGTTKVGGTHVYVTTSGEDNKYLHIVQAIGEGEIDSLVDLYLDDTLVTDSKYDGLVSYTFHTGSPTQGYDSGLNAIDSEWTDCMRNTAYLYIKIEYNRDVFTSIPKITLVVKGRKVYDTRTDVWFWSANPALIVYDFMTNKRFGIGLDSSFIDTTSISNAATWCDNKGYRFNGVINTKQAAIDNLTNMLATFKCGIVFDVAQGKFKLLPLEYDAPVMSFSEDDFIDGSFKRIDPTIQDIPNTLKVKWINPDNYYVYDDLIVYNKTQIDNDGEKIEKNLVLLGCSDITQARSVATYQLERMRLNKRYSFSVKTRAMPLEAGDMIIINYSNLGVSGEQVRVERITPTENDTYNIVVSEEHPDLYNDKIDIVTHNPYAPPLPDGTEKPAIPTNLSLTTGTEANQQGLTISFIIATWDQITSPLVTECEIKIRESGTLNYSYVKVGAKENAYKFGSLKPNTTYYISIRSINEAQLVSNWSTEVSILTAQDEIAPAAPTGVVLENNFDVIYVKWTKNSEPDIAGYEVYASTTSGFTPSASTLKWRGTANNCSFYTNSIGTWYVKIIAYDITENVSSPSTQAQIDTTEISSSGYNLIINSDFEYGTDGWSLWEGSMFDVVQAINPKTGKYAAQNNSSSETYWGYSTIKIPIQRDRTYIVEGYFKKISGTTGTCYLAVKLDDVDGNNITGDGGFWYYPWVGVPGSEFEYHSGIFGFNTSKPFPSNATHMHISFILNYGTGRDSIHQAQGLRIREVIESAYIEDAAITTAKIQDLAVNSAKINDVSADKMYTGTLYNFYGDDIDYISKFNLDEGELRIRGGVSAPNFINNPYFINGSTSYWSLANVSIVAKTNASVPAGCPAEYCARLQINASDIAHIANTDLENVAEGENINIQAHIVADSGANAILKAVIYYHDSSGAYLFGEVIENYNSSSVQNWTKIVLNRTIPTGQNIAKIRIAFYTDATPSPVGNWFVTNIYAKHGFGGGDEVVLKKGDVEFYKYGDNTPFKYLRKIDAGTGQHGDIVNLTGYYDREPKIIVTPDTLMSFNKDNTLYDQSINCTYTNFSGDTSTGEWSFQIVSQLKLTSGTINSSNSFNGQTCAGGDASGYIWDGSDHIVNAGNDYTYSAEYTVPADTVSVDITYTVEHRYQTYDSSLIKTLALPYDLYYTVEGWNGSAWTTVLSETSIGSFSAYGWFRYATITRNVPISSVTKLRIKFRMYHKTTSKTGGNNWNYVCNRIIDSDIGLREVWGMKVTSSSEVANLSNSQIIDSSGINNWLVIG